MASDFTFSVDDALNLAYITSVEWNSDGTQVGYLRFERGDTDLATSPVNKIEETDLSMDPESITKETRTHTGDVSEFDWRPEHPNEAAFVSDGVVKLFDTDTEESRILSEAEEEHTSLEWHPEGNELAYIRDGTLWVHDLGTGGIRAVGGEHEIADLFSSTPVKWSPSGDYVATLVSTKHDTLGLVAFDPGNGEVAWDVTPDPTEGIVIESFDWVDDSLLVYTQGSLDGTHRSYMSVDVDKDEEVVEILSETDERVLSGSQPVGNDEEDFAVLSARTGHHHVYVVDVKKRRQTDETGFDGVGITQVTDGEFEARGDALDTPAWSENGKLLAYVTNQRDRGERHLHVAEIDGGVVEEKVFNGINGNLLYPTWSGNDRIACVRAGRKTPADVHVVDVEKKNVKRLSASHPDPSVFDDFPEPQHVSFEGTKGMEIHGYLYTPPDAEPGDDLPAVIWCHGGPIRQMRRGFHHMRSYSFFHAFNHVLVSRGYAVLELNYRGGIGYGRGFEHGIHHAIGEDDIQDCVDCAGFLRSHDMVGEKVGLWGLSYGGFLANAVATKTDAVDCAVNFAGIWDWRDWVRYASDMHWGAGRSFQARFGGHPDDEDESVEERYSVASPREFADGLDTPLFALHGTDDPNVPFEQMDFLVNDLVDEGLPFEMAYYPDEDHMFEEATTWRDALDRVLPFLDENLS